MTPGVQNLYESPSLPFLVHTTAELVRIRGLKAFFDSIVNVIVSNLIFLMQQS